MTQHARHINNANLHSPSNDHSAQHFFGGNKEQTQTPFFGNNILQPKLKVGAKDDAFEKQADSIADKVVNNLSKSDNNTKLTQPIQTKATETEEINKKEIEELDLADKQLQKKAAFESDEPPPQQVSNGLINKKSDGSNTNGAPQSVEQGLSNSKGGGASMDTQTKNKMESAMGADFSNVRIHNDSNAQKMSNDLGAHAFTHGNDIYFNSGKYDPNSTSGNHLLAHELTHTVQQGASVQRKSKDKEDMLPTDNSIQNQFIQRSEAPTASSVADTEVVDVSSGSFNPSEQLKEEIANAKHKGLDINIKAAKFGASVVKAKIKSSGKGAQLNSKKDAVKIPISLPYLSAANPTLYLTVSNGNVTGKVGTDTAVGNLDNWISQNTEALGWFGIKVPSLKGKLTNSFESGTLNLGLSGISVRVGGFANATLNANFQNLSKPIIGANATIKVGGLAEGTLDITNEQGPLTGSVDVGVNFAMFSGNVTAKYLADGNIDIKGTVSYSGNKLSGSLTLISTDKATADSFASQVVPAGGNAGEAALPEAIPTASGEGERGMAGMGTLNFNLTEWFAGTVSVIVDGTGAVTVVGKIAPPKEIELFPQKDLDKEIFKFEARAAYGIPVVGNVFVFANIGLRALAKLGPAKLYNIEVEGTYSTNPDIAKHITLSGSLNISAYAGLRLRAEGGAGLTILGHDIKLGVGVDADAGVKGYVDARPTIGYRDPGEFFFKGHMEIGAQPFLGLSGDLFVELDSPWWSPAPDKKWTWPIGSLEYPLPGEFGIGADMEYVLGSGKVPEIKFSEANFDGGKFMTDLVDKKVPGGGGKGKQEKSGKFTDGGAGGSGSKPANAPAAQSGTSPAPAAAGGKGSAPPKKKGKDADKNDELKQMDAAMKKVKALEGGKPLGRTEIVGAINKIKQQHKVNITFKEKGSDEWIVTLDAKGKKGKQPAKVKRKKDDDKTPQNNDPKKQKLLDAAIKDIKAVDKQIAGDGKLNEEEAKKVTQTVKGKHSGILKTLNVTKAGKNWKYNYIQRQASGSISGSVVELLGLPDGLAIGMYVRTREKAKKPNSDEEYFKPNKFVYKILEVDNNLDVINLVGDDGKIKKYKIKTFHDEYANFNITKASVPNDIPHLPLTPLQFDANGYVNGLNSKGKPRFQPSEKQKILNEYKKQLKQQEGTINAMSLYKWLKNKKRYDGNLITNNNSVKGGRLDTSSDREKGRQEAIESFKNKREKEILKQYYANQFAKMKEKLKLEGILKNPIDYEQLKTESQRRASAEAQVEAEEYVNGKSRGFNKTAVTHATDGVGGGDHLGFVGTGHSGVNSSIGSTWKVKSIELENVVKNHMKKEEFLITPFMKRKNARMNVILNM